jgi:hypothetical protein
MYNSTKVAYASEDLMHILINIVHTNLFMQGCTVTIRSASAYFAQFLLVSILFCTLSCVWARSDMSMNQRLNQCRLPAGQVRSHPCYKRSVETAKIKNCFSKNVLCGALEHIFSMIFNCEKSGIAGGFLFSEAYMN